MEARSANRLVLKGLLLAVLLTGVVLPGFGAAVAVAATPQTISFTSTPPLQASVGGPPYNVTAAGGASGEPVVFTIDPASSSVCSASGATVSFIAPGTCTIDANQAGNTEYEPAPQAQQSLAVKNAQSIFIASTAPASATVGGSSYTVSATASSGLPVIVSIDFLSTSVCSISGSTVSFIGAGTCTIDADQQGNAEYWQAPEEQQSFTVVRPAESKEQTPETSNSSTFSVPTPASELFAGQGQVTSQEDTVAPTAGVVHVISTRPNKRSGGELLVVKVTGAGVLSAREASSGRSRHPKGKGTQALIKAVSVRVVRAGKATLRILPTKAGASELKRKRRLSVKVLIAFTPTGGTPGTIVKTIVLGTSGKHH